MLENFNANKMLKKTHNIININVLDSKYDTKLNCATAKFISYH